MNKQMVLASLLIGIVLVGLVGCVGEGKQAEKKEKAPASVEAIAVPTQELKTHVSKYGFSVKYPREWRLDEYWDYYPIPKSKQGLVPFAFSLVSRETAPEKDLIGIFCNVWALPGRTPQGSREVQLRYLAKNQQMTSVDNLKIFKNNGVDFALAYGVPRGRSNKYYNLFFILPKMESVVFFIFEGLGKYSIDEVMRKMIIEIDRYENK